MGFSIFNPTAKNSDVKILQLLLYRWTVSPSGAQSHHVYTEEDYFKQVLFHRMWDFKKKNSWIRIDYKAPQHPALVKDVGKDYVLYSICKQMSSEAFH